MKWYYETGGEQQGPVDEAEIRRLVDDGDLTPSSQVWHKEMGDWTPVSEVFDSPDEGADEEDRARIVVHQYTGHTPAEPTNHGGGAPANPFGALSDGLSNLTGRGGGILGGLRAQAQARADAQAQAQRDFLNIGGRDKADALRAKPIPTSAAQVRHDFVETTALARGSLVHLVEAAKSRLEALTTAWKMNHTQEPDYAAVLSNFREEVETLKAEAREKSKKELIQMGILFGVMGLVGLMFWIFI